MSDIITIDEWLFHYIADIKKCDTAYVVLQKIYKKCDRLAASTDSPLMDKLYGMMKECANWDVKRHIIAKYFINSFYHNSLKFVVLNRNNIAPLPDHLKDYVPLDDVYLVETALATADKIILTTDLRLREVIGPHSDIKIHILEEFQKSYG